jgi:hypothetical protein
MGDKARSLKGWHTADWMAAEKKHFEMLTVVGRQEDLMKTVD